MRTIEQIIPKALLDTVVLRKAEPTGVLQNVPLLTKACRSGAFGTHLAYCDGSVDHALFVYLSGEVNRLLFAEHPELFYGTFLVCLSQSWMDFLFELPTERIQMSRRMMHAQKQFTFGALQPLPPAYAVSDFDAEAFAAHPFGHGVHYADAADFAKTGIGSVVRYQNQIVCAASSFISWNGEIELDLSTAPAFRRKGLATHALQHLLKRCAEKGIPVHWDAQNDASAALAERFGFSVEQEYAVTVLAKPAKKGESL